jgi:hypothetical protein
MRRVLSPIQVALQNHLSCYLIDITPSLSRFLACVTQCAVSRDSSQALVPGHDRTRQNGPQLFYKLKRLACGCTDLAVHLARNTGHNMIDLSFANDFCDSRRGLLVCWNSLKRVRQQL